MNDDENIEISCELGDIDRIQCPISVQYLSSLYRIEDCLEVTDENNLEIPFERFYNSFIEYSLKDENNQILSSERMNDGIIDCLGSSDEPRFCREFYPLKRNYQRFRCQNSDLCLLIEDLCDGIVTCPNGDDEFFCQKQRFLCDENFQSMIGKIFCQSIEYVFSMELMSISKSTN